MLTCLAMAFLGVTLPEIPALAAQVETEARALTAQTEVTAGLVSDLETFSTDAMRLSDSLRAAGVSQDLPCIFRGISEDARERVSEFQAADTPDERETALTGLHVLLDDAILLAPMAAGAAADAAANPPPTTQ